MRNQRNWEPSMSEASNSLTTESTIDDAAQAADAIQVSRVKNAADKMPTHCDATAIIKQIRTNTELEERVGMIRKKFRTVLAATNDRKQAKDAINEGKKNL